MSADTQARVDELNRQARLVMVAIAEHARFLLDHLDDKAGRAHVVASLGRDLTRLDELNGELDELLGLPNRAARVLDLPAHRGAQEPPGHHHRGRYPKGPAPQCARQRRLWVGGANPYQM